MDRLNLISDIIQSRRTVKPNEMDAQRDVPKELLDQIFENANWAPTHGMTEPWRFKLFAGESRKLLGEKLQYLYVNHTSKEDFKESKMEKLGRNPQLAPVVIAVCMKRGENEKIPVVEEIESVACSVQNIHLTASAAGLGGFWSTPKVLDTEGMRKFLKLGNDDLCLGLFYLGWLKEGSYLPKGCRRPIEEKLEWM